MIISSFFHSPYLSFACAFGFAWLQLPLRSPIARLTQYITWAPIRIAGQPSLELVGPLSLALGVFFLAVQTQLGQGSPWMVLTALLMGVMGLIEDKQNLDPIERILFQALLISLVVWLDPGHVLFHDGSSRLFKSIALMLMGVGAIQSLAFFESKESLTVLTLTLSFLGLALWPVALQPHFHPEFFLGLLAGLASQFFSKRPCALGRGGSYFFGFLLFYDVWHGNEATLPLASLLAYLGLFFLLPISYTFATLLLYRSGMQPPFRALRDLDTSARNPVAPRLQLGVPFFYLLLQLTAALASLYLAWNLPSQALARVALFFFLSLLAVATALLFAAEWATQKRVESILQPLESGGHIPFYHYRLTRDNGSLPTQTQMRRLNRRIRTEIRVSDFAFVRNPNLLFVTLKVAGKPPQSLTVSSRVDAILQEEGLVLLTSATHGKRSTQSTPTTLTAKSAWFGESAFPRRRRGRKA